MVVDAITPPGTICGTSFTPAAVAGVAGLIISRNPSLTASQVTTALTSTAVPVAGVAFGRVDALAAFERLGLLAVPASGVTTVTVPTPPVPGQLYARQARFDTGEFRRGFRKTFRVGKGRFEMQVATPLAGDCFLSLASATEVILASPAFKNLLSLSTTVTAGRYTAEVHCRGARTRQYSLGVIGMFPREK